MSVDALTSAVLLSLLAGLATTLGSLIAFIVKSFSPRTLSLTLGFSAGVMISVSFIELLTKATAGIGFLYANVAFFIGFAVIFLVDTTIPHQYKAEDDAHVDSRLLRTGVMTAIGIAIHNFPEGIAVFAGSIQSVSLGTLLAIAIAIHNIPEGISVSIPVYYATKSKRKAFLYSSLSGLAEPVAALTAAVALTPFLTPFAINILLATVAGIMVYISFDELLPAAHKYGEEHTVTVGLVAGMILMAATLYLLYQA